MEKQNAVRIIKKGEPLFNDARNATKLPRKVKKGDPLFNDARNATKLPRKIFQTDSNLRDRGYPQSRTEKVNRSDRRNALMTNDIGAFPYSGRTELGTNPVERVSALDKLANAYNNRVFGNSKMPLIAPNNIDYVTDDTDERAYMSGYDLWDRNNNRLAFAHRDVRPDRTGYYAGVDNLPFGDNYVSRDFTTPLGNITAEYDGDGTASLSYETSPNVYYVKALANLLLGQRGKL